jgi:hypothetical protein
VLLTSQTGNHRSDRSDPPVRPVRYCCTSVFNSSVLALWINQGTQWFSGEPSETLRTRCGLRQLPLMTRLPRSPGSTLVLWLQPRNRSSLHLVVLATMRPALDSAGHRVPRMKPTCFLHTWRPHRQRPFALVLHLLQHQSSRNLHLQYLAQNESTQRCQSLITQGSDHPPVLEPHMVVKISPLMSALTTYTYSNPREKKKKINE